MGRLQRLSNEDEVNVVVTLHEEVMNGVQGGEDKTSSSEEDPEDRGQVVRGVLKVKDVGNVMGTVQQGDARRSPKNVSHASV